jgi:tyrosinase-like protein
VGINGIFSNNSESGGCSNCEEQAAAKLTVMDVIPLTRHLIKWLHKECPPKQEGAIRLESLEHEEVQKFLLKNLHWRVADMNLHPFTGECDFVKVSAVDRIVRLPKRFDEAVRFGDEDDEYEKGETGQGEAPPPGEYTEDEQLKQGGCCGLRCTVM